MRRPKARLEEHFRIRAFMVPLFVPFIYPKLTLYDLKGTLLMMAALGFAGILGSCGHDNKFP